MKIAPAGLEGAFLVEMTPLEDERGFFARSYCERSWLERGLIPCGRQWSVSFNRKAGTVRGLHFQAAPHAETKLVRCTAGAIYDVIVDMRRDSPGFGRWIGFELTAANHRALYIPAGFAHGFQTLQDESEVLYAITPDYVASAASGLHHADPALGIRWPLPVRALSARDAALAAALGCGMMRVLVTGATGFVGQHSLSALLRGGAKIHAVSRRSGSDQAGVTWHRCDLLQEDDRARLIERIKPTHLLHFAWATEHGRFWDMAENHLWLQASYDLIRRFSQAGGQRVAVAGSCAEYDWQDPTLAAGATCDERSTPACPATLYGRCKLALLDWLRLQPGLSHAWGRIFFAYGPGEDRRRLVPSVILSLLANQPAKIGPGTQIRDFLDVRDIAAAFAALLIGPVEGVVNIGAGLGVSIADLARAIALAMGRSDLLAIGAMPARDCDPPYLVPKIDRLRDEVGFSPSFTQKTGLEQAIAWWRYHQQGELS